MEYIMKIMESILRIDSQGRIVLPKEVRQALKIGSNEKIICRVVGNRVILEKFSIDSIHKAFMELAEKAPDIDLDREEVESEDKYIDKKYALRKIGL
jgi:AbrB family looped-hinge helix DNA binding protein